MPLDAEDLARAVLIRAIPRRRFRIAGSGDARFAGFAAETARIAFRQHGADPALLVFCGPGQDARAAAVGAAAWASENWRPNAIQRRVRPGVLVVQVAPAAQLGRAGPVPEAAVPAAIWVVDADSGRCQTPGRPPGTPAPGEVRSAAARLARGTPAPSLGELDYAERELMHGRAGPMPPVVSGIGALLVVFFALRFVLQLLGNVALWGRLVQAGGAVGLVGIGYVAGNVLLLAGILLGAGLLLNVGGLAYRAPGFASPRRGLRWATWAGYVAVMLGLLAVIEYVLPHALRAAVTASSR